MSPRQARRERREAERKSKKAEIRRMNAARSSPAPDPISSEPAVSGFVSQPNDAPAPVNDVEIQSRREINRANAQHSTGPRSQTGKLASSRNSLKHGLASGTLIIPGEAHRAFAARCARLGEDAAAFEALQAALIEEHQPATETEALLVTQMAQSWWLTQRAIRLQNDCFTENGVDEKRLSLFLCYQSTHDRAFHKSLNTLIRLQKDRRRQAGFVSQSTRLDRAAGFSKPKIQAKVRQNPRFAGFVSQEAPTNPQNPPPTLAEAG